MEAWGPVGAVAVILGLIELLKWTTGHRARRNGSPDSFNAEDRRMLTDVAHRVKTDQWAKDLHDLLGLARKVERVQTRMFDKQVSYNERMIEHFSKMECIKRIEE